MSRTDVVTAFLTNPDDGTVLLVRRSSEVRTYRNHWSAISGYLEVRDPLLQAEIELREETGLGRSDWTLKRRGHPLAVDDRTNDQRWRVHPFRFASRTDPGPVRLNRENDRYRWVEPAEISSLETVPGLQTCWERIRGD